MDEQDHKALHGALDDLIDGIVKFKGKDEQSEEDLVELMYSLDYSKFIVSGIIYANGICICNECGTHNEDTDD